jgi:serine/threonine-protein kinase
MALNAGSHLGPYEVLAAIGAGGMGEVYRARDSKLDRDVALKILPEALAADPDRIARFEREAKTLAALNQPHIAQIYGLEESNGVRALVMELVDGPTLADRLAQGPIPTDEALPIAKQIAEALEAAHEQGIIHRDLKPANIKVRADGTVKVLDFGLAKAFDSAAASGMGATMSPTLSIHATQAGIILGTAAYMAPEQARGKAVDKRADIWAFGCVLFEMLTGRRAFEGDDISVTLASVLKTDPDWDALPPATPPSLRRLLGRCLRKDPRERLRDIGDARVEIGELLSGVKEPITSTPIERPVSRWRRLAAAGAALPVLLSLLVGSVITGIAVWNVRPPARTITPHVTRWLLPLGEGQQFTNSGRQVVAVSPDGTEIAYVANYRLYLRSMTNLDARPVFGTEGSSNPITNPVFSPDGQWLVFYADNGLKKIAVTGGAAIPLCQAIIPFGISWDQDAILFGQGGQGILRVSANGGSPVVVASVKNTELAYGPQVLPGGSSVLFTVASGDAPDRWDHAQIVVQSLKSGERKVLIEGGSDGRYVPTGHLVYALSGSLLAVPFDVTRLAITGGPTPVVDGVLRSLNSTTGAVQFSISATGSLIYVPGPAGGTLQMRLAWIDRRGHVEPLRLPVGPYEHPRIAPDGRHVAYDTDDGKDAIVWVYDLSGGRAPRRLTFGGRNRVPVWSPDGASVAFQSDREGDAAIFSQHADTGSPERLTKPEPGTSHVATSWSRDGTLLFEVTKGSDTSLWSLALRDKKAAPFAAVHSDRSSTGAAFSPDGRWVAYTSTLNAAGAAYPLFVQPFPPTGTIRQIVSRGVHPSWSPDGRELFFDTDFSGFAVVSVSAAPTFTFSDSLSVPKGGANDQGPQRPRNYDIGLDGKRFLGVVPGGVASQSGLVAPQIEVVENWFEELKARVPTK